MNTVFFNINIDFLIDKREQNKLIKLFEKRIKIQHKWIKSLHHYSMYIARYSDRRFIYIQDSKTIIPIELVLIWNHLYHDGTDLSLLSKIYQVKLPILKLCLKYYLNHQEEINSTNIRL